MFPLADLFVTIDSNSLSCYTHVIKTDNGVFCWISEQLFYLKELANCRYVFCLLRLEQRAQQYLLWAQKRLQLMCGNLLKSSSSRARMLLASRWDPIKVPHSQVTIMVVLGRLLVTRRIINGPYGTQESLQSTDRNQSWTLITILVEYSITCCNHDM